MRTIPLEQQPLPPSGVAYDQVRDLLYVLRGGDLRSVVTYDLNGRRPGAGALERDVWLDTLAYDSGVREFYVSLRTDNAIGVFDLQGHLIRTVEADPENLRAPIQFDAGPRSFLRLF